ncbi:MAG TPA: sulfate/molybdate ABC transporter ATP-binding protein [Beijerinckiaceae bacterium]|nr:sulfate/molybdate ABC transporter ATP-binding protein [Beijerinckiaceae bacterium]
MDVRVAGIVKQFGAAAALRGVSLDIRAGELMALLGPSGSGKTTLLRVIAGLEFPEAGQVFFGDEDATRLSVQRRGIGFVFQHYALFKHLTVLDNIAYGLRVRPRTTRPAEHDIRGRVGDLLDLMQLQGLGDRFPAQLSGGQRQRVALARALAIEPRVLLLDEPFGALDAKVRKDLRRWLRGIHERTGKTTIFVTHDQDEALELADRVAVLNDGLIEQVGSPDEMQDRPASPFVMTFLGDAARFNARVVHGRAVIKGRTTKIAVPDGASGEIAVYCRPWDLRIVPRESADVMGTVHAVRRVGATRRVEIDIDECGRVEVQAEPSWRPNPGAEIGVSIERARVFPDPAVRSDTLLRGLDAAPSAA